MSCHASLWLPQPIQGSINFCGVGKEWGGKTVNRGQADINILTYNHIMNLRSHFFSCHGRRRANYVMWYGIFPCSVFQCNFFFVFNLYPTGMVFKF